MDDVWFALSRRPTEGEHVKTRGGVEQAVLLQIIQGEAREAALLGVIDGSGRPVGVVAACRTHLDENDTSAVQGDNIQLTVGASVIASQNAVAEAAQKTSG